MCLDTWRFKFRRTRHFYAEKPPCITQATSLGRIAGGACIAVPAAKTLVFPRCSCTERDLKKLKAQPSLFLSCNSRQMWKTDAWPLLSLFLSPSLISDVHLLIRVYGTLMHHPTIRPSLSSMRLFFRPNDDDTPSLHCGDEEDNANYKLQTCTQVLPTA